jgi:hypothetical protein
MKTVRDILLAMLNATMILAIVLVVCLIVLVGRVSHLRDTTVAMLAPQSERLAQLTSAVQGIEGKIGQCSEANVAALREELRPLIANAPDLSGLQGLTVRGLAEEIVDVAGERLAAETR